MEPGGGGCWEGLDKSQWKNLLHDQGSVKKPHTEFEILNPQAPWALSMPCNVKSQSGTIVVGKVFVNYAYVEKLLYS